MRPGTRSWAVTDRAYREWSPGPGQDLGARPAGEGVAGEAGLPALVRLLGLEPDAGGSRPLARLGDDQGAGGQVPADRSRRPGEAVVMLQVPGDRVRSGVHALLCEFLAQPDDQVGRLVFDRAR